MAKKKAKGGTAASEPNLTVAELSERYIAHMEEEGKSAGTVFSYAMELKVAQSELGADTLVSSLTAAQIEAFNTCQRVMRMKTGRPKAEPSFLKTRRVLRLALAWAEQAGVIARSPISPKGAPVVDEPALEKATKRGRKTRQADLTVVVGDDVVNGDADPETIA